MTVELNSSIR